jgi:hypothetical protein
MLIRYANPAVAGNMALPDKRIFKLSVGNMPSPAGWFEAPDASCSRAG